MTVPLSNTRCRRCRQLIAEAALVNESGDVCEVCPSCESVALGLQLAAEGMAAASVAHPDDAARVMAAIKRLAATGREFSANDSRPLHGVTGGVVGAQFTAAIKANIIRPVGSEPGSVSAHGKPIYRYVGINERSGPPSTKRAT